MGSGPQGGAGLTSLVGGGQADDLQVFLLLVLRSESSTYVFCGGMSGGLTADVEQCHVIERWWCSALGIVWRCHMRPLQEGGRRSPWDDGSLVLFHCENAACLVCAE